MKSTVLHEGEERSWALVFEVGDQVVAELERFARDRSLASAHFTAIGAFEDVVLRYFDWERREYEDIPVREQVEVLTLAGNISTNRGEPQVHAHVIVGRRDGSTRGGHLKEARVRPTLELMLTEEPSHLRRRFDERTGLPLIDPSIDDRAND